MSAYSEKKTKQWWGSIINLQDESFTNRPVEIKDMVRILRIRNQALRDAVAGLNCGCGTCRNIAGNSLAAYAEALDAEFDRSNDPEGDLLQCLADFDLEPGYRLIDTGKDNRRDIKTRLGVSTNNRSTPDDMELA